MESAGAVGIVGLGFLLIAMSGIWTTLFTGASSWTPEKSARSSEIKNRLHNLSFIVNSPKPNLQRGDDIGKLKAEYVQLVKENGELNAEFASATEGPKTVSKILKWGGISLAVLGMVGWYAISNTSR